MGKPEYEGWLFEATPAMWQPINTAPKDGSYIICNRLGEVCPCQSRDGHRIVSNMPGFADWTWPEAATGWMPLPKPPKISKADNPVSGDVLPV